MKKNYLIGVSPRIKTLENGTRQLFDNQNYISALSMYGFNSIILTTNNPNFEAVLDLCDGFLITGGIDVHPKYYKEDFNGTQDVDDETDVIDETIIKYALKTKKPMLGICRGHQAINVFMGGSLIQDIGSSHQNVRHDIKTFKNDILPFDETININSFHHQVIKDLAPDLIEVGKSSEGYNECFVSYKYPIISCQWHPERLMDEETSKIIFTSFKKMFN